MNETEMYYRDQYLKWFDECTRLRASIGPYLVTIDSLKRELLNKEKQLIEAESQTVFLRNFIKRGHYEAQMIIDDFENLQIKDKEEEE